MSEDISTRYCRIQDAIRQAALRCGRNPNDVILVGAAKFQSETKIATAYHAGLRHIGENYIQELIRKREDQTLGSLDLQWRFIGGLQRNKARFLVEAGAKIDSVNSLKAAKTISRLASECATEIEIMLQVNLDGEESKSGFSPQELNANIDEIRTLPGIELRGLMTIPSPGDEVHTRKAFATMRRLAETFNLHQISMGMSQDFEWAIEEGATHIRIGTALFGPRT